MNFISDEQKFLENYKKKIIKETLKTLFKNYQVYDSNDNLVDIETIQHQLLSPKVIKRCIGTTNTSPVTQCTRNAIENYDYCKSHLYKMCFLKSESNKHDEDIMSVEYKSINNDNIIDKNKLKRKFIEDSFYFVDNKFIYDSSYNKVGYINETNNYILTNDPFILESI